MLSLPTQQSESTGPFLADGCCLLRRLVLKQGRDVTFAGHAGPHPAIALGHRHGVVEANLCLEFPATDGMVQLPGVGEPDERQHSLDGVALSEQRVDAVMGKQRYCIF